MGDLEANRYRFTYTEGEDIGNKEYKLDFDRIYGDRIVTVENDFMKDEKKIEVGFAPTLIYTYADKSFPFIDNGTNNTNKNSTGKLRLLQYKSKTCASYTVRYGLSTGFSGTTTKTIYPYMGHLDDPTASTTDINFGMPRRVNLPAGIAYTNSNLYNVYWSKYIGEITNKNSKIVRGAFYLNPVDMEQLSFRDLYYFDNNYFRLNKVEDYDPVNPSVNICEFLLLNQGASFAASGGTIGSGGSTEQEYDPIGGGTNGKVIQNKGVSVGYYNRIGDGIGVGDAISNDGRANTAIGTNGTSFLPDSERSVVIGKGVQNVASDEVYLQGIKVLANDVDGTILDTTGAADGDALVYDLATKTWKPTAGTPGSYDDEQAQDAIGTILVDGATIDFTYNDATPSITAEVKNSSIGESKLLLADVTTHNVSTSAHGFVPKAPNTTTDFLRGDGTWAAPTDPTGYTTIVKSANQDVTNAGVTNDNDFSFAVVAGGH
jgi:hypothetical protein